MSEKKEKGNMTFEEALSGLERCAEALKNENTSLETAIQNFEQGVTFYQCCEKILNEARQKIEIYEGEKGVAE